MSNSDSNNSIGSSILSIVVCGVLLFLLNQCEKSPEYKEPISTSTSKAGDYTIKLIDGCEYIEYDYGSFDGRVYSLTHKGNCQNKQHSYNK